MGTITFGRRLVEGRPTGPGVTVDADGPTAALLAERSSPVISNPVVGEWAVALREPEGDDGASDRGLGIYSAGNTGPPEHFHPDNTERFEVVEGRFVFTVEGEDRELATGDEITVDPRTAHTFRNETDSFAVCLVELRPPGAVGDVLATLAGLAHDGKLTRSGRPRPLQGIVMAADLANDTVFTSPPPPIQRATASLLAPIARRAGYRATYPEYLEDVFWEARVEQPP